MTSGFSPRDQSEGGEVGGGGRERGKIKRRERGETNGGRKENEEKDGEGGREGTRA